MTKKVPIKEATEAQLREFGESNLGLQFEATDGVPAIRSKIQAAWNKDHIELKDEPADKPAKAVAAQTKNSKRPTTQDGQPVLVAKTKKMDEELVRVMIPQQEGAGGKDDVPLGCNGDIMTVPRGKIVDIPKRYFESLKNAVQNIHDTLEDGSLNPVPRKVPLYPYHVYTPMA